MKELHKNAIDISGKTFGRLEVIKPTKRRSKGRDVYWLCRCICGSFKEIIGYSLRSGNTKSCGCLHKESVGGIPGDSIKNKFFDSYKRSAKKRNLCFDISRELFEKLASERCYYCNVLPQKRTMVGLRGFCNLSGIDRLNNNVGYIEDNCVPCCSVCNRMKLHMPIQEFLFHIKRIYEHSNTD